MKKKRKKKCKNNCNCDPLENFQLPPCAKFLGSPNPLVRDGEIIYSNFPIKGMKTNFMKHTKHLQIC